MSDVLLYAPVAVVVAFILYATAVAIFGEKR